MEVGVWWVLAVVVAVLGSFIQSLDKNTLGLAIGLYVFAGILFICPIIGAFIDSNDKKDNTW